jgi:hypothetical protein
MNMHILMKKYRENAFVIHLQVQFIDDIYKYIKKCN